ncbi:hypothetical protein CNR22_18360 [Sphingobacteriaceae bacterium]|nr:hypothetical protein CNR22_18360 [Sphingobacteriaceae bacterium]
MKIGDVVYFWMAVDLSIRGIYGWGTISRIPYQKSDRDIFGVDVIYRHKFKKPILAALAMWRPEVLKGSKSWDENYSDRLADNIYLSIIGYLDNLNPEEKAEAWLALSELLRSEESGSEEFDGFCKRISKRIERKSNLDSVRAKAVRGILKKDDAA